MNKCNCYYNEKLDVFEIYSGELRNPVSTIQGKYGIELTLDIDMKPISILIPEPEILLGIKSQYLRSFTCNFT